MSAFKTKYISSYQIEHYLLTKKGLKKKWIFWSFDQFEIRLIPTRFWFFLFYKLLVLIHLIVFSFLTFISWIFRINLFNKRYFKRNVFLLLCKCCIIWCLNVLPVKWFFVHCSILSLYICDKYSLFCWMLNVHFLVYISFQLYFKMDIINLFFLTFYSQVSVIRGQVMYKNGQPLIGVKVGSVSNPAYGYTLTRQNGM